MFLEKYSLVSHNISRCLWISFIHKYNRISGSKVVDRLHVHGLPWSQYDISRSDNQYVAAVGYGRRRTVLYPASS